MDSAAKHLTPSAAFAKFGRSIHWLLGSGASGQPTFDAVWFGARISLSLALVCAAPFVYNAVTHFAYDDCATLAEGWEKLFTLSAAGDGEHLLFHMDKGSVYRLMLDGGALDAAEEELGGKAAIELLKQRDGGRATFLPMSVIRGQTLERIPAADEGCLGTALSLAQFDPE